MLLLNEIIIVANTHKGKEALLTESAVKFSSPAILGKGSKGIAKWWISNED